MTLDRKVENYEEEKKVWLPIFREKYGVDTNIK